MFIRDRFRLYWSSHQCDKPGCGWCFISDGGMKMHRKVCGATMSGVTTYDHSNVKVLSGCLSMPIHGKKVR